MPETAESLDFSEPVCSVCKQAETKNAISEAEWADRRAILRGIVESARRSNADYEAIIPFSGGKDSTFTLWYAVRELGLRCLVVRFNHHFFRQGVQENWRRTSRRLGVDSIEFTPNWHVVRRLMLESLKRRGDFCWHCHSGVFAYPVQEAVRRHIPLIIWGEGDNEYASWSPSNQIDPSSERHDQSRFDRVCSLGIAAEDMVGMLNDSHQDIKIDARSLAPFTFPGGTDVEDVRQIFLGSYISWNPRSQAMLIKRELGWQGDEVEGVPPQYDYDKIECAMQGARDYIKFLKRGFGRTAHLTSIDIRNGLMSREEAIKLCEEYDGKRPASLDHLLTILELSEPEFLSIVSDHVVYPHIMAPGPRANRVPEDIASWAP